eukprot:Nk52_evm58s1737 gene=Nk52_evmTU58s1737
MAFMIRSSKFRHVYGSPFKKEECYDSIRTTRNAWDSNFCSVNPTFFAVVLESGGGGAFMVSPLTNYGKFDVHYPTICGHKGNVLDIAFNPFNDYLIASASEDCTVKIWQIPEGGFKDHVREPALTLNGHGRKVGQVVWHPTANNILYSSSADLTIRAWNVETGEQVLMIEGHGDTIYDMTFSYDGSKLATTCKDKKIRVFDAHTGELIHEALGHQGTKPSRCVWLGKMNRIFSTGFSRMSERQYSIWDADNLEAPLKTEILDTSSGVLMPFFDPDVNMVYIGGKGDGNIRYYEVVDDKPYIYFLSEYKSSTPQRGFGWMPKRGCDVTQCEVARFYKLYSTGLIEPIRMVVPRKSDMFQEDIFPDCASYEPALTAEEWLSGKSAEPKLMSLKDGFKPSGKPVFVAPVIKETKADPTDNPQTDKEYREAFHILKSEVEKLKNETAQKDVQIRQLQQELKSLKA